MKRILAILLVLVLAVPIFWFGNPFAPLTRADASIYYKGFDLVAEKSDRTGILPDTDFLLTIPEEAAAAWSGEGTVEEKEARLVQSLLASLDIRTVSGSLLTPASTEETEASEAEEKLAPPSAPELEMRLLLSPDGRNRFRLTLTQALPVHTLIFVNVTVPNGEVVTFAFQTRAAFAIAGTLPADQSTGVPVDTGIELYFTHAGATGLDRSFSISPDVAGRFEVHGQVVAFIPRRPLETGTLYTITVEAGFPLAGTEQVLAEDKVFSFETAPDYATSANPDSGYLGIHSDWLEFPTGEKAILPFDLNLPDHLTEKGQATLTVEVFRFKDVDAFINALETRDETPVWAWWSRSLLRFSTNGMEKQLSYEQAVDMTQYSNRYTEFPEILPSGFYLVNLGAGDVENPLGAQALLQVTDTAAWFIEDADTLIFWVNSMKTGAPLSGTTITNLSTGLSAETDLEGLAIVKKTGDVLPDQSRPDYFRIETSSGETAIYHAGYPVLVNTGGMNDTYGYGYKQFPGRSAESRYWRYAGLDRTLYKPSDTVRFWGFARSRLSNTSPDIVKVEVVQGGWYFPWMNQRSSFWMPASNDPLLSVTLPTVNGFWDGSLELPALEAGAYTLQVKAGDNIVATSGFTVENYVKPAYQLTATVDKTAVFPGETANFFVTAAFYDGTPVAHQDIRYTIWGPDGNQTGEGRTDGTGTFQAPWKATYVNGYQGESHVSFHATAILPESGEISAHASLRVFMNDILVDVTGEVVGSAGETTPASGEPRFGRILVDVAKTDLIPLNDDDPDNDDQVRGDKVAGQRFAGTVIRTTWERFETGETYDFVNKVVVPQYEYREKRETLHTFTIVTDEQGLGSWQFPMPLATEGYYTAELTTNDGNNRPMKFSTWHSPRGYQYPGNQPWYSLETDQNAYREGDAVSARMIRSDEIPLQGRTLFITSRNGLQTWEINPEPLFKTTFLASMSPNVTLDGVMFDGRVYHAHQTTLSYDAEEKRIQFDIQTDKDGYRPGDTVTVTVTATDAEGNPVLATVNVALVDEALFSLSEQYTDVLASLYSWMDDGILRRAGSSAWPMSTGMVRGGFGGDMAVMESASMESPSAMDGKAVMMDTASVAGEASYIIRSDFRDSAYFTVSSLDENGTGTFTFKIPDNITSWRVSVSGISTVLHGGEGRESAVVSLPFFLSETLNATYLAGDAPEIGFTAYGTSLESGDTVTFNLTSRELPSLNATVSAKAFERIHLPVGALSAGTYTFILKASSEDGLTDAIERTVTVVDSFREMQKTELLPLVDGMVFPTGTKGMLRIAVTDPERATLMQQLQQLSWGEGHRLDQQLVTASARRWLNELLADATQKGNLYEDKQVDVASYWRADGGYGILPYAESDLRMTVLLTDLLRENGSTETLKLWLYNMLYAGDSPSPAALYGLSVLGEPVLPELQEAAAVKNASLEDRLFLILGFATVGDLPTARGLWDTHVASQLESADPYVRVRIDATGGDRDEALQLTALASVAGSILRLPEADGLHRQVADHPSKNVYSGVETLLWLKAQFTQLPNETLSFSWSYGGVRHQESLENGAVAFITIPAQRAAALTISSVSGNGVAAATWTVPRTGTQNDPNLTLKRTWFNETTGESGTTFGMNDLIRVELDWNISNDAMDSVYEVTDWLPAGLSPIDNPWQYGIRPADGFWYRSFDGQQVHFVVGRDWKLQQKIVYYARVTSPGEYTAEGASMRGSVVQGSQLDTEGTRIYIRTE